MSLATLSAEQPRAIELRPARDATVRLFWIFAAGHVAVWMAVCLLTHPNAPLDMIEMISWGNHLEWGYYKHPPMPAWIAWASIGLFGKALWPIYLATQLTLVASMWAAWRLARRMLRPWPALCAALMLEGCYYFTLVGTNWNHNVIVRLFWSLSVLLLYRAIEKNRLRQWLAAGVCLGLGMLSKYDIAALALAMLAFALLDRRVRPLLRTPGPYWMTLAALAIFAPHALWMYRHGFSTISYAIERGQIHQSHWTSHLVNPLLFLGIQLAALPVMMLAALPLANRFWRRVDRSALKAHAVSSPDIPAFDRKLARDYLLAAVLGPLAVDLLISLLTGAYLIPLWGASLWTFVGVALVFFFAPNATARKYRQTVMTCALLALIFAGGRAYGNLRRVHLAGKPSYMQFPGRQLAAEVDRRWAERFKQPLHIIAGRWWEAGNVSFYSPGPTIVFGDLDTDQCPWCDDEQLRREGGVILWPLDGLGPLPDFSARFPEAIALEPITLPWQSDGHPPPTRVGMAIVPPQRTSPTNGRDPKTISP